MKLRSCSITTNLLPQHISSRRQQEAELVGFEIHTAGSVDLKTVMQFFDFVFHVPTAAIDPVNSLRFKRKVRDDIAGIVTRTPSEITDDFSFDNKSTGFIPCFGLITDIRKKRLGFTGNRRQNASRSHEGFDLSLKNGITCKSDQVFHTLMLQIIQDRRRGESTVKANSNPDFGKRYAQTRNNPGEDSDGSIGAVSIAGTKNGGEEVFLVLLIELQRSDHGQIAERVVMPVEEAELLRTMGWVISRIHIDGYTSCFAMQPFGVMIDHNIGQAFSHAEQVLGIDRVLEARQCWLGPKALTVDRITVEQEFLNWIICQGVRIITIRVAGCNTVDTLSEKIQVAMNDFPWLPRIAHTNIETFSQSEIVIYSFEQNSSSIGATIRLIEVDCNWFVKIFSEKYRLCGKLSHREAFAFVFNLITLKYLYEHKGFLFYIFMNNPG
jgi:hypothetical protein